jgi:DNA primase
MEPTERQLVEAAFADAIPGHTGWYRAFCPFCTLRTAKPDRRRSFGINAISWKWHCFKCGVRGKLPGIPDGITIDIPKEPIDFTMEIPEGFWTLGEGDGATAYSTEEARDYLAKRNVSKTAIKEIGIGACLSGKQEGRIVVPIATGTATQDAELLGWVGRVWHGRPTRLRYVYPPGMKRAEMLFNVEALSTTSVEPLLVVEGVFDALPHWPHAVACLGKPSQWQVEALSASDRPVVVALDGDAWQEGRALALRLKIMGQRATFLHLPPKSDPGDMLPGELLDEAQRALEAA